MQKRIIFLALLLGILHSTSGLYFHMREKERKCFIQAAPDDTDVVVQYKVEVEDPRSGGLMALSPRIGMQVEIRDSDAALILSRDYGPEARLKFTTSWPGDHKICLEPTGSEWFSGTLLRVHLDIKIGEKAVDYENLKRMEGLDNMQLRVRQLMIQAEEILKDQNYQRFREERFRNTTNSVYFNIIYFSVGQAVLLVLVLAIQYHLLFRKPSLYLSYCHILGEKELARFRTPEAFRALMAIWTQNHQGLTTSAISQWINQFEDPELTNEKEQILISEKLQAKVKEFAGKFLTKPAEELPGNPKASYFASNVQLRKLLSTAQRNRSVHLKGDTFLLVCECQDCKAKGPNGVDTKA
ncbi:transmembrane emp24 domain-containing protein eca [Drosophila biarmipes]|uniref:transmembrane emp24 domain-containing protein eca n=1 Tax=Drosophila biarmipes TaxID=125945 RepID=UPI0007E655F6|nr:transmembrane emp24 domain-containing protein eca [Drosophila biarmipes]